MTIRAHAGPRSTHLPDPTLERLAAHLIALGPRPLAEFLRELRVRVGRDVEDIAAPYRRLHPALVRALGADRFPARLISIDGGLL